MLTLRHLDVKISSCRMIQHGWTHNNMATAPALPALGRQEQFHECVATGAGFLNARRRRAHRLLLQHHSARFRAGQSAPHQRMEARTAKMHGGKPGWEKESSGSPAAAVPAAAVAATAAAATTAALASKQAAVERPSRRAAELCQHQQQQLQEHKPSKQQLPLQQQQE